ncbi:bifunctional phosphoribosylaminoimidazolecarboxamide formyltransferase/IMP cyclohydrolase [Sedimentisphaera salicampi]|uniref:Bifunctional purine biosynthesis protein PurH n=1 Tax=Sedimentisphaera salicampi TaxID=1941349 RepID=A0A1W6LPB6_9BACT|nr:bifunctional phosphoribosylaminoimidazolecarboxamide formyltransferase/IMP cyclohydrolase [Sedimentisphaera salicampi]ARN57591.1 Bifunctional purine biosynthesis protein PurH [Sedimentisphaera salicampi]
MDIKIKTALISVSDKTGVAEFAKELSEMGVRIISTGGTAKKIQQAGVDVVSIDSVTGFPEMMNGRVKTLHPIIHGGLLGLRDNDEHTAAMSEHGIDPIDLVCVNLYPFENTVAKEDCTLEDAIENIDIGGPSMVRSASKNYKFVTVVTNPSDYGEIISQMKQNSGSTTFPLRERLAREAFALTAGYDAAISKYLSGRAEERFPKKVSIPVEKVKDLRYGENPHQQAAFYRASDSKEVCVANAEIIEGGEKDISFNNLLDANAAFELVKEFDVPAAVVVKHLNPCGCSFDEDIKEAYRKAYLGDVVSAFGGIIALNRPVDRELAEVIMESYSRFGKENGASGFFAEVIIAPYYEQDALETIRTLKGWGKRVRLLKTGEVSRENINESEYDVRCITGGLLLQQRDLIGWEPELITYPTKLKPTDAQMEDLKMAWICAKHVKSNTITLVNGRRLVGCGAGQMNRVESGLIAFKNAGTLAQGAALGSDAFFPFPDNVENAAQAGVKCIVQPGGSKKDDEVIAKADELGIAMIFTSKRHFRH